MIVCRGNSLHDVIKNPAAVFLLHIDQRGGLIAPLNSVETWKQHHHNRQQKCNVAPADHKKKPQYRTTRAALRRGAQNHSIARYRSATACHSPLQEQCRSKIRTGVGVRPTPAEAQLERINQIKLQPVEPRFDLAWLEAWTKDSIFKIRV